MQPVDDEGKFTDTIWKGQFVMDADPEIIQWLRENGKLYKKTKSRTQLSPIVGDAILRYYIMQNLAGILK